MTILLKTRSLQTKQNSLASGSARAQLFAIVHICGLLGPYVKKKSLQIEEIL